MKKRRLLRLQKSFFTFLIVKYIEIKKTLEKLRKN